MTYSIKDIKMKNCKLKNVIIPALGMLMVSSCQPAQKKEANHTAAETAVKDTVAQTPVEQNEGYIVRVGQMAPDFTMKLTNGEVVKLSEQRGKVVMLQFTASWCSICRKEMPFIESDIWNKHKENPNFALFGIDRDEPLETVVKFAEQTGVTYPMGLDPNADIFALFAERNAGITRNVIIDKTGKIVMLTRKFKEEEFKSMTALIDKMLQE